jgi:cytochrome c-type biogenesis protein CcmE
MRPKHRRLFFVTAGLALFGAALMLVLLALEDSVTFFYTPSQAEAKNIAAGQRIRLGGLVEEKSVRRSAEGTTVEFAITDRARTIQVRYNGVLPDLFREGQGVVVQGAFGEGRMFTASTVLAKHDENYVPRELVEEMKKQGLWKPPGQR